MTAPTFSPPTAIDCYVTIAGERVADGTTDDEPYVLSGLKVTWGRASTVDQPDTASLAFQIEDRSGDQTFAKIAAVGKLVEVHASATLWDPDELVQTIPDPGFDATAVGSEPANIAHWRYPYIGAAVADNPAGGRYLVHGAGSPYPAYALIVCPGAPTTDVSAWDSIPRTVVGQVWHARIGSAALLSPAVKLSVGIARITSPADTAAAVIEQWHPWDPAAGPFDLDYSPQIGGEWLGVAVFADPGAVTWDRAPWPSWDEIPDDVTWDQLDDGYAIDDVTLTAPAGGTARDALVFAGRISDVVAAWDEELGSCLVDTTGVDLTADLANRDVGAEPWPLDLLSRRVTRILTGAGADVDVIWGPSPATIANFNVSRVDVDRQDAWPMIADLIAGVDGVAWLAVHNTTGPYLYIEDMAGRPAVLILVDDGTGSPTIRPGGSAGVGITMSATDVDLDPVRWTQTNSDLTTRVKMTWQDQSTTPDVTDRTLQVIRSDLEAITDRYGVHRTNVSSQLADETTAAAVAQSVLTRLSRADAWRVGGIRRVVEPTDTAAETADLLDLLDGTARIGAGLVLTDLPAWSPIDATSVATYVEGGRYEYRDGRWVLELILSDAHGIGASVTWDQLDPAWSWDDFGDITWDDLTGVGPPPTTSETR